MLKWALEVEIANRSLIQFPWDPRMLSLPLQQKISLLQDLRFKQRRLEYCFLLQTKSSLLSYILRKELLCRSLGLITPFLPDAPTLVQVIIYCLGGHMSGLQAKTQWAQAVYSVLFCVAFCLGGHLSRKQLSGGSYLLSCSDGVCFRMRTICPRCEGIMPDNRNKAPQQGVETIGKITLEMCLI